MTIEKSSCYKFEIIQDFNETWIYKIYGEGCPPYDDGIIDSEDWYDTEQEARFAAIGHITKLENGQHEPNYDAQPPSIDWDERRKIGE